MQNKAKWNLTVYLKLPEEEGKENHLDDWTILHWIERQSFKWLIYSFEGGDVQPTVARRKQPRIVGDESAEVGAFCLVHFLVNKFALSIKIISTILLDVVVLFIHVNASSNTYVYCKYVYINVYDWLLINKVSSEIAGEEAIVTSLRNDLLCLNGLLLLKISMRLL